MHTISHWGCTDAVKEPLLEADWEKNPLPHRELEHTSVSKQTWCLTSTETIRLIRDGEKGGGGGMEVGGEGDYIPIATLSPPE